MFTGRRRDRAALREDRDTPYDRAMLRTLAASTLIALAAAAVALPGGAPAEPRTQSDDPTPLEAAEIRARELDAIAEQAEQVARDAGKAARFARARADAAKARYLELRGRAAPEAPGDDPAGEEPSGPDADDQASEGPLRAAGIVARISDVETTAFGSPPTERIHAAADNDAAANKKAFLPRERGRHMLGAPERERVDGFTFSPDEAPDLGDLEIVADWQWAINVSRGSGKFDGSAPGAHQHVGNLDYARLTIRPMKGGFGEKHMKWGMRRFNLGDVTVVDCDFTDIPLEHGVYDSLAGHALYLGNTFHRLGGQAIQIAHRDRAYQQYGADNLPFRSPPLIVVEDCHAVDCGRHPSRSGFTWTFFDPGTEENPGTLILRGCTSVHAWDFARTTGGERTSLDDPRGIRSPGGLVVHHTRPLSKDAPVGAATRAVVIDRCLFDHTGSTMPIAAIRGVETILIEDSCFIARDHRRAVVDIDDVSGQPSGRVIIENCVSPEAHEVMLRIRKEPVRSMHCAGERIEIDVATGEMTVTEVQPDPLTRVISPLVERRVEAGVTPQPPGHEDLLGPIALPALAPR